jgi:DNA-binding transcriptional regulator YiaG
VRLASNPLDLKHAPGIRNLGNGRGSQKEGVTTLARTKSLSKQIRQAREVKGFTVAELADRLGVSQVSIYYWESGRVRPRDTNLTALCKALKMPMRETMALTGR